MNYTELSVDQLFGRYYVNEDERTAIEGFIRNLSQKEIEYFEYLKKLNNVDGEEEAFAVLASLQSPNLFSMEENKHILYDRNNFISSKGYVDDLLKEYGNDPEMIPIVVEAEKKKVLSRLLILEEECTKISSLAEHKKNTFAQKELKSFIAYLDALINSKSHKATHITTSAEKQEITYRTLALYCFYLQEKGYMPWFDNMDGGKQKGLQKTANEHGFNSPTSWKSLQQHYNEISNPKSSAGTRERINPNHIKSLKMAISMLTPYPEALKTAEDELKTAISNT